MSFPGHIPLAIYFCPDPPNRRTHISTSQEFYCYPWCCLHFIYIVTSSQYGFLSGVSCFANCCVTLWCSMNNKSQKSCSPLPAAPWSRAAFNWLQVSRHKEEKEGTLSMVWLFICHDQTGGIRNTTHTSSKRLFPGGWSGQSSAQPRQLLGDLAQVPHKVGRPSTP